MFKKTALTFILCSALVAHAQPTASFVKLVVPFPPGDALETAARTLANLASTELGRTIVIENKPGAAGYIAAEAVARSTDGNTFLLGTTAMMSVTPFLKKAPYAPSDFEPIGRVASITGVFTISNKIPATTLREFTELAKKNPGQYTYASPGEGTMIHIGMEMLQKAAGFTLLQVPYKGMGPALQDFVGGQIDVYSEPAVISQVKANNARALAIMGEARLPDLPNVPTLAELNIRFDAVPWIGVFAPKSMPAPLMAQMESALLKAAARAEFKVKLPPGVQPWPATSQALKSQIQNEQTMYRKLIADLNLKVE